MLDPGELISSAQRETGLTEFDGPDVFEPLQRLTRSLLEEAALTPPGVQFWHHRLLGILITRLRACDWFRRHPEILEEELPPAVVILGLARTGTTLLHRAISADPRFYTAAWWEVRFPVPADDDVRGDKRIAAAKVEVDAILTQNPDLAAIHPWDALGADEDIMLLDQTLLSTTPESLACIPSFRQWLHAQDLRPAYEYLLRLLKFLQWQKKQRGLSGDFWVLKTPMHLGYADVLLELWPQLLFAQTHRDPLVTLPSYASFIYNLWRSGSEAADGREAARQWTDTLEEHLGRCMAVRERIAPGKFIDVDFRETVRAPLQVIERIYERLGLAMTNDARGRITAYLAAHPREGRPKHEYTLEQFGFSPSDVEERFRFYRERHILRLEVS
jgi:hypothetical protein